MSWEDNYRNQEWLRVVDQYIRELAHSQMMKDLIQDSKREKYRNDPSISPNAFKTKSKEREVK